MLKLATTDDVESICIDDPVRPDIPYNWRLELPNKFKYYLDLDQSHNLLQYDIDAVCCIALQDKIPTTEEELLNGGEGENAIFYTVWSKQTSRKGKGREVLNQAMEAISKMSVTRYVTLSPKTEMAMKFHLNNGAVLLKENELTFNFEYKLP